jgi:hypothetical protein
MEQQICAKQETKQHELFSISCWKTKATTTNFERSNMEAFIGDGAAGM